MCVPIFLTDIGTKKKTLIVIDLNCNCYALKVLNAQLSFSGIKIFLLIATYEISAFNKKSTQEKVGL